MASFYVTTAIPYVNAAPHLGFALELVQTDVLARYHRLRGDDTWFLTGTDENSLTNVLAAEREGVPRPYRGSYCVRCERFYTTDELVRGRCPEHEIEPEVVEEENYFFRLSRYADQLTELLTSGALRARARGWGISVPNDPDQVIYVWFDALTNYITALGYGSESARFRRYWTDNPHRVHMIGKDILRFHAVYWPALLLSAGLPAPSRIIVHGFLTKDGRRMSKTLGTGIDPAALVASWGVDTVRYWLLREVSPADDADYTETSLARAYTADLANDLGNLLQRTTSMIHRYRDGVIPTPTSGVTSPLPAAAEQLPAVLHQTLGEGWDPRLGLEAVFNLVVAANRFVEDTKPWALARAEAGGDADAGQRLDHALWNLAECLRLVAEALRPFLPETADRIAAQLGARLAANWTRGLQWGLLSAGGQVAASVPLFPKPEPPSQ